jgi:hypothetical protein
MCEEMTNMTGAVDGGQLRRRALRYTNPNITPIPIPTPNHRALSEESIRKARISALQAELNSLEKDLASHTPTTQSTVEQLAQSECLNLTHRVMSKLPRELRDMIYSHLSTRSHELIEREHFRTTMDPLTRLYSYNFDRWKAQHFPEHYWSTPYVPETFYQELVENYYRTSTFHFSSDPGVMKRFLTNYELCMGILPVSLVSNIEIALNAVSHDRGSFRAYMFGIPKSPERMKEALEGIWELKHGARVVVRFVTEAKSREERDGHCAAAMSTLFDPAQIQKIREKGLKVKFVVDEGHVHDLAEAMRQDWRDVHG